MPAQRPHNTEVRFESTYAKILSGLAKTFCGRKQMDKKEIAAYIELGNLTPHRIELYEPTLKTARSLQDSTAKIGEIRRKLPETQPGQYRHIDSQLITLLEKQQEVEQQYQRLIKNHFAIEQLLTSPTRLDPDELLRKIMSLKQDKDALLRNAKELTKEHTQLIEALQMAVNSLTSPALRTEIYTTYSSVFSQDEWKQSLAMKEPTHLESASRSSIKPMDKDR